MAWDQRRESKELVSEAIPVEAPYEAHRLLAFWQSHARDGTIPSRDDFTPDNLLLWIEDISIYEYHPEKDDYQILLEGENIVALTGEDWRGAYAREIDCRYATSLHAALSQARRTGQAQIHLIHIFQKEWLRGVRLLLPVRRVGKREGEEDLLQIFLAIFPMPAE